MATYFEKCAIRVQTYRDKAAARVEQWKAAHDPAAVMAAHLERQHNRVESHKRKNLVCKRCHEHGHQICG